MQIELIPDEEYELWEQVLAHAEGGSAPPAVDNARVLLSAQSAVSTDQFEGATAAPALPVVPEIEDFGLKLNRLVRHRPRGLSVTDLAQSEWCQQQVAYAFSDKSQKEKTEAMVAGTAVHAALEAELVKVVHVDTANSEDRWAVRLLNVLTHLHQLLLEGKTREMFIWGYVKGQWIRGIIDEMELDERGRIRVAEHKTRKPPTLPRAAQQRSANLQVMTYRMLLEQLSETCSLAKLTTWFNLLKLDAMQPLSDSVQQYIHTLRLAWPLISTGQVITLSSLAEHLQQQVLAMPQCSDQVVVRYIWQGDRHVIGEVTSEYDQKWVTFRLQQHIEFLEGVWTPQALSYEDTWKCFYCKYCVDCPVGRKGKWNESTKNC